MNDIARPVRTNASAIVAIAGTPSSRADILRIVADLPPSVICIVCIGHQQAIDEEQFLADLAGATDRDVSFLTKGPLHPDSVRLVREAALATIDAHGATLVPAQGPAGHRGRIDTLLVSIARSWKRKCVAVVLAGVRPDGTLGVGEVKQHDGLTIAQIEGEPEQQRDIGRAAGAIADYLLPPGEIGACLARYIDQLAEQQALPVDGQPPSKAIAADISRIITILQSRTGHDFHGYKLPTFIRRILRRMQVTMKETIAEYVELLRQSPPETQRLFDDLLIGVTAFFRDPAEFAYLERHVIPKLFEGKGDGDRIRIWVLGCATGEEAYSIAMLLKEGAAALDIKPVIQIFATDIDNRSLATARVGRYSEVIEDALTEQRLNRWFVHEGNTYSVIEELREICIFSQHSLVKDAPFSRINLVSCRNLLIYLNREMQDRVIPLFHFALEPDGHLFLGTSENVSRHTHLFAPVDRRARIYRRQEVVKSRDAVLAVAQHIDRSIRTGEVPATKEIDHSLAKRAQRVVDRYSPAYAVIDQRFDVLHFSYGMGPYLDPVRGAPSFNLLNLVARDLRLDLREMLQRAVASGSGVHGRVLRVAGERHVTMAVEPMPASGDRPLSIVVIFREVEPEERPSVFPPDDSQRASADEIDRLEEELLATRDRLQTTIEELETTNEELKSSVEEYQSLTEEMQSTNEELETSREELQSVNEELQTINGELGNRVAELGRANSDLSNLLESTRIATIFLDIDLRVKLFTPAVAELFHLIDKDAGRPIEHISSRLQYPDMRRDCRQVLQTLATIEREVNDPQTGARYLARVLPYRSADNFIAGVVLTFLDVTATTRAEAALRESEERFRNLAGSVDLFLFIAKRELDWDYISSRFFEYTGMTADDARGEGWLGAVHETDVAAIREEWAICAKISEPFEAKLRFRNASGEDRWFLCRAIPRRNENGTTRWYGSCTDIHSNYEAEERLRFLMGELQHRVKNILAVVRAIFGRTVDTARTPDDLSAHFAGRIDALARTQGVLVRAPQAGVDLEEVVLGELVSHGGADDDRIVVHGPSVRLRAVAAEAFGLLVHELATNAAKYGALAKAGGRLKVAWRIYDDGQGRQLSWEWTEQGVAIVDPDPSRRGFGRELIEVGLPYQLGGQSELTFLPGGIRCRIELPLSERVTLKD